MQHPRIVVSWGLELISEAYSDSEQDGQGKTMAEIAAESAESTSAPGAAAEVSAR